MERARKPNEGQQTKMNHSTLATRSDINYYFHLICIIEFHNGALLFYHKQTLTQSHFVSPSLEDEAYTDVVIGPFPPEPPSPRISGTVA